MSPSEPTRTPLRQVISAAKLTPLVQRGAEVPRRGIAERLERAGSVRLILIRAPAGSGKTTTMAQLRETMQQQGIATAWITLDASDNDVPRFLAGLAGAAATLGLESAADGARNVLEQFAAEATPYALFLDDFEVITERGVIEMVRELLDQLPRQARMVIGSRSLPELGLGRLRARGQLLDVGSESLRFTTAETAEFFRIRGAELSFEALDRIHGKTEGWVAALWLLSLALQRDGPGGDVLARLSESEADLADYLSEEVLARQPPDVRDFLLRTSILRQLSAPACHALLPGVDCESMLHSLERGNIFLIPVDHEPGLYRYHGLFAGFLRRVLLRERPTDVARLHLAASGWYEAEGRPVPAIDHAIEGGNYPRALHLLELHSSDLLEQGRMRLLDRWFSVIPTNLLRPRPLLQVIAGWARCFSQGPWVAMTWLQSFGCEANTEPSVQAHLRALMPVLLAMMDRYKEAYDAGRAGVAKMPSGNAFADGVLLNAMAHIVAVAGERETAHRFLDDARRLSGGSAFNRMYTETVEGMLDLREGRLRQAKARFRMAITSSLNPAAYNYAHGNAWAGVPYTAVMYETNDLSTAERLLNVYLPLARDVGLPDHMITTHRLRCRIAFDHGDIDTALQALTELEYLGHQRQLPRVTVSAKLERSRILALQGYGPAAREELARAADSSVWNTAEKDQRPAQDVDDLFIARTRIDLYYSDPTKLVPELETRLRAALQLERKYRAMKLRLLLAIALLRSGNALRAVEEAVPMMQEACQEGFVRLLLDEGPAVGPLIRRVRSAPNQDAQEPVFREYLAQLAELLGSAANDEVPPPSANPSDLPEPLTRKEIRVLQLLAEGYSNTALAEKLFVADSTVRTHLRSINAKLSCHNRTQAVAVARRLGLIP